jgi:hypothetical protein
MKTYRDVLNILKENGDINDYLEDLKKNMEILYQIGFKFEESGLCSIDTLKILKKHVFMTEVENDVYKQ